MKNNKTLWEVIWEFVVAVGTILGILSLIGARIEQGIIYAVFGSGIVILIIQRVVEFFKKLDENIKYIKDKLERGDKEDE